jgi:hypothetical protein
MSLAIDVDKVRRVLLADGKWYNVALDSKGKSSFTLDAYEFIWHRGLDKADIYQSDGRTLGAMWTTNSGVVIACCLDDIQAVQVME